MRPLPSSLLLAILRRLPSSCGSIVRVLALPRIVFDLLLAPVLMTVSVLASLLLPVQAHAQLAGAAQADYSYQRSMSRILAGSASGLQMSSNSTMDILSGGRRVGSIALKEKRLMDLAALAGRAMTLPGMVALGATVLLDYGLQKCADGSWCTKSTAEQAPNGYPYPSSGHWAYGGDRFPDTMPDGTCIQMAAAFTAGQVGGASFEFSSFVPSGASAGACWFRRKRLSDGAALPDISYTISKANGCSSGHTLGSDGMCYPPGYVPGNSPVPATPAQVNTAWQNAMKANPYLQEKTWGFEDQTQQNEDWAKAMAQLAEITGNGTVTDVQPQTSYTDSAGKVTKKQTTCTYTATPNSNTSTAGETPLNVGQKCVTTTTAPDGTTTTETTETATGPAQAKPAEKIDIETCGLPNKPACKIDETGTPDESAVKTAGSMQTAALEAAKTAATSDRDSTLQQVETAHADAAHIFQFFAIFPTFATETCENPTVPGGIGGGSMPVDICTYYYMLKDVMSFGVALYVLIDSVQQVRSAVAAG